MKRRDVALPTALIGLLGLTSPALAHGEEVLVYVLFFPATVQLIEGVILGIMIMRRLGAAGALAIVAFVGGVWTFWWLTFASEFHGVWISLVTSVLPVSDDAVFLPTLWLLALLAGPVPAIVVALTIRRLQVARNPNTRAG